MYGHYLFRKVNNWERKDNFSNSDHLPTFINHQKLRWHWPNIGSSNNVRCFQVIQVCVSPPHVLPFGVGPGWRPGSKLFQYIFPSILFSLCFCTYDSIQTTLFDADTCSWVRNCTRESKWTTVFSRIHWLWNYFCFPKKREIRRGKPATVVMMFLRQILGSAEHQSTTMTFETFRNMSSSCIIK